MYLYEVGFHIGREEGGLGVGESTWNDEGGGLGVGESTWEGNKGGLRVWESTWKRERGDSEWENPCE